MQVQELQEDVQRRRDLNEQLSVFIQTTQHLFQHLAFTDDASNPVKRNNPDRTKLEGINIGNTQLVETADIFVPVLRTAATKLGLHNCWNMAKKDICHEFVALWNARNDNDNHNHNNAAADDGINNHNDNFADDHDDVDDGGINNHNDNFADDHDDVDDGGINNHNGDSNSAAAADDDDDEFYDAQMDENYNGLNFSDIHNNASENKPVRRDISAKLLLVIGLTLVHMLGHIWWEIRSPNAEYSYGSSGDLQAILPQLQPHISIYNFALNQTFTQNNLLRILNIYADNDRGSGMPSLPEVPVASITDNDMILSLLRVINTNQERIEKRIIMAEHFRIHEQKRQNALETYQVQLANRQFMLLMVVIFHFCLGVYYYATVCKANRTAVRSNQILLEALLRLHNIEHTISGLPNLTRALREDIRQVQNGQHHGLAIPHGF